MKILCSKMTTHALHVSYHSYNFKTSFKLQKIIMLVTLTLSTNMIPHILYINKIAKTLNNNYERLCN